MMSYNTYAKSPGDCISEAEPIMIQRMERVRANASGKGRKSIIRYSMQNAVGVFFLVCLENTVDLFVYVIRVLEL